MSHPGTLVRVEDLTWTEFESRAPSVPYWMLVAGSVEQHGPHLPLGSDTLIVERLAELAAARHGAMLLGAIRVGVLHTFKDWPGSQWVDADVLIRHVQALSRPMGAYANRLLVLNGHDENHEPLMLATRELAQTRGTDVLLVEWAHLVSDVIREVCESTSESHAGEGMTSLLLHWFPAKVRSEHVAAGVQPEDGLTRDDLYVAGRAHHVLQLRRQDAPTGVIGDPRSASAAKGAAIADALLARVDLLVRQRGWL